MGQFIGSRYRDGESLNEQILRSNAQRAADRGEIRPHEVDQVVELSKPMFKGTTSNGEATRHAIELVKKGLA